MSKRWCLLLLLWLMQTLPVAAGQFSAEIKALSVSEHDGLYWLNGRVHYQLSPTALEALNKGVPLSWVIVIKVRRLSSLWPEMLLGRRKLYSLRFHALLNQYVVADRQTGNEEMFLSLNAALHFMASLHDVQLLAHDQIDPEARYQVAVKAEFDREFLPSPLRPLAYLDGEWFLSSDWTLCPFPNLNSR